MTSHLQSSESIRRESMSIPQPIYTPLDIAAPEIRVLTVHAGNDHDPIECHLSEIPLSQDCTYDAISYVWSQDVADALETHIMLNDHHRFGVTPNLHSALRHLRPPLGQDALTLWIDAICINQEDVIERNSQVAMMRDIYASATRVVIWLGEKDADSDVAIDAMSLVADCDGQDMVHERTTSEMRQALGNFYFNLHYWPWFERVWCIQELAMARNDPLVVCGMKSVPWSTFVDAWQLVAQEPALGLPQGPTEHTSGDTIVHHGRMSLTKLDVLDRTRKEIQSHSGFSLEQLLIASRTSKATDPRDRVYGLLGLLKRTTAEQHDDLHIVVDYAKSCAEVYADATAYIFATGGGPNFLTGMILPGTGHASPQVPSPRSHPTTVLPSWVPDFSHQIYDGTTQPSGRVFCPPTTMHASGAGAEANNGKRLSDMQTLQVEGLQVDIIEEVFPFGSSFQAVIENLTLFESKLEEARIRPCLFADPVRSFMEKFRSSEPLWRTLISNTYFRSSYEPAPMSYEGAYEVLMERRRRSFIGPGLLTEFENRLQSYCLQKAFFTTSNGFVGTCVRDTHRGDKVVIIFGAPTPFVMRPLQDLSELSGTSYHTLVGGAYVGGIMGGEVVDELYCEDLVDSTTFYIR